MKKIIIVFILSLLTACAFVDPHIAPTTRLQDQRTELVGGGRVLVVQMPFVDQRLIKDRCGMQKNGYGMDTASVICDADPTVWIAKLFVQELRAAGFVVKTDRKSSTVNDIKIHGSLLKLFSEPVPPVIETDIHIKLIASTDNGFSAERSFFVKNLQSVSWGSYTGYCQQSIDKATRKVIQDMVSSIVVLLIRYPKLSVKLSPDKYVHSILMEAA